MLKPKLKKLSQKKRETAEVISFQTIRRAVGWFGILLPVVLVLGSFIFDHCQALQPSISHYYYTNMREIFVGVLGSVSLFLFTYKGFSTLDSIASSMAGFFSLTVALFPTDIINGFPCQTDVTSVFNVSFHDKIHLVSAALFFITLALMSIFLFTKSKHIKARQTPQKRIRNVIYIVTGIIMLSCIAAIGIYFLTKGNPKSQVVFWFEALALLAFGISWLTKGEALFGDK